jgi:hypothetical protein
MKWTKQLFHWIRTYLCVLWSVDIYKINTKLAKQFQNLIAKSYHQGQRWNIALSWLGRDFSIKWRYEISCMGANIPSEGTMIFIIETKIIIKYKMQAETNLYLNRGFLCLSVPKMYNANLILIILQNVSGLSLYCTFWGIIRIKFVLYILGYYQD